jgi:hypothetical protein
LIVVESMARRTRLSGSAVVDSSSLSHFVLWGWHIGVCKNMNRVSWDKSTSHHHLPFTSKNMEEGERTTVKQEPPQEEQQQRTKLLVPLPSLPKTPPCNPGPATVVLEGPPAKRAKKTRITPTLISLPPVSTTTTTVVAAVGNTTTNNTT